MSWGQYHKPLRFFRSQARGTSTSRINTASARPPCRYSTYGNAPRRGKKVWTCTHAWRADGEGLHCECLGFLRWGRCKHCQTLAAAARVFCLGAAAD
jgi:hypothetical protein